MVRPRIKIELDTSDKVMEAIGIVFLILMISFPSYYFFQLPDIIPIHFNGSGEPDGYGDKSTLFLLPIIAIVMYIGMNYLNKFPHILNYPTEITKENAETQYRKATKMLRTLNLSIAAIFFFITYKSIMTALHQANGLGSYFTPISLTLVLGPLVIYLFSALKKF